MYSTAHLFRLPLALPLVVLIALMAACSGNDDASEQTPIPTESQGTEESDDQTADTQSDDAAQETPPPTADGPDDSIETWDDPIERLQSLDLALELIVEGFIQPTDMVAATDGTDRLFVTSRVGIVHVVENGVRREEPLLDIQDQIEHHMVEQGMLSIALHPDFADNGYFYVYYITHGDEDTMISRFEMAEDGQTAKRESETTILQVEQPHYSHNGGNLKFGPDGYLYIGLGDGEDPGDPHGHSQNPGTLLGSILRIDVDGGDPYAIPEDNPFVGDDSARDEVWAYGLRNPWRFSFDPVSGDMYMVDVGQWDVEEVNFQPGDSPGGENYGWPIMEGDQCWDAEECDQTGLTMPVATYENPANGCAIIGGYTYRGAAQPELDGVYLFGDWCSGNVWGLLEHEGEWFKEILIRSDLMINAFGTDHDGEVYVLNFEDGGGIYRIVGS